MARFAKEITMTAGQEYNLSSITGYTPAASDNIIVTPLTHSTHTGNLQLWVVWGSGTWKVNASDTSFAGKVLVAIKT
tara:strand:+ start:311 stop:541 length:231 start_codon:yes stop_codon:yes gene_type:complete